MTKYYREDDRSYAWSYYRLVQIFPSAMHCDGGGRWGLYDGTCPNLLRGDKSSSSSPLIVTRYSFSPWTWARFPTGAAKPFRADVFMNFWYTFIIILDVCVIIFIASPLWLAVSPRPLKRLIYKFLNVCPLITRLLQLVGRFGSRKSV